MGTLNIDTKVNILGTEYTIRSQTEQEEPRLENKNGFTDWTTKLICLERKPKGDIGNMQMYMNNVIQHELVHAFLYESGFGDSFVHFEYGHEETVVDWFAYHMKKIEETANDIFKHVLWSD